MSCVAICTERNTFVLAPEYANDEALVTEEVEARRHFLEDGAFSNVSSEPLVEADGSGGYASKLAAQAATGGLADHYDLMTLHRSEPPPPFAPPLPSLSLWPPLSDTRRPMALTLRSAAGTAPATRGGSTAL